MKKILKRLLWVTAAVLLPGGLGLLVLNFPQPLFGWSAQGHNLRLYSDQPFQPDAGVGLLERVQVRLSRSPLYSPKDGYSVFICNSRWRQKLFFLPAPGAGGVNYHPWTTNVFLVGAKIEENRLITPSWKPDLHGRRLDHFATHELTHTLTSRVLGFWRHRYLPDWIKEGYAEYIARGRQFSYGESLKAFQSDAPEMGVPKHVPYRRYELMVAYLLERRGWTVAKLLANSIRPDPKRSRRCSAPNGSQRAF